MPVDLSSLRLKRAAPIPYVFGGPVFPTTGGEALRVDRMGSRWQFAFATPAIGVASDEFDQWSALIGRAEREGALCPVSKPGFVPGVTGAPVIAALTTSGRTLPVTGLPGGYTVRPGWWVSVIVSGRRYLDQIEIGATGATVSLGMRNLIRTPYPANAVVELGAPKIEGLLQVTAQPEWNTDAGLATMFEFTITEAK